jgi:Coenzyme PQQ synthesis protein D (PqqD)
MSVADKDSMSEPYTQAGNLDIHEVPDGYIVYQPEQDRVHYLNPTAAVIFELCNGRHGLDEIVSRVANVFELDPSTHDQIRSGLDSLIKEGLILSPSK